MANYMSHFRERQTIGRFISHCHLTVPLPKPIISCTQKCYKVHKIWITWSVWDRSDSLHWKFNDPHEIVKPSNETSCYLYDHPPLPWRVSDLFIEWPPHFRFDATNPRRWRWNIVRHSHRTFMMRWSQHRWPLITVDHAPDLLFH